MFWELGRRTNIDGIFEDYAQPYFEVVNSDPGLDEMRQVVCDKGIRPSVPNRWQASGVSKKSCVY